MQKVFLENKKLLLTFFVYRNILSEDEEFTRRTLFLLRELVLLIGT